MQQFVSLPEPQSYRMKNLFSDNVFTIPSYQREYSWDSEEAIDLLHDIYQVANNNENIHFFGSVVILPSKNQSNIINMIIDGQQRISTSAILIAIFRDIAKNLIQTIPHEKRTLDNNEAIKLNKIKDMANGLLFKNNSNNETRKKTLSLKVAQSDESYTKQNYYGYFNGLILRDGSAKKYYDSDYKPIKLVHRVHEKLRRSLSTELKRRNNIIDKTSLLYKLFTSFISRFYVVLIKAPTREDAITVYMTLNNRGKDLSTADIVKGQLAGILEDNHLSITEMMSNWNKMAKQLNNDNKSISYFIREYWAASHGVVPNSQLARTMIHHVNTPKLAKQTIKNLLKLVPLYKTLCNPTSEANIFYSPHLIHIITILNKMGLRQYYSVLLAMYYKNYSEQEIDKVMYVIESTEMRRLPFHSLHAHYSNRVSIKIWNNKLTSIDDITQELRALSFSDARTKSVCNTYQHKGSKTGMGVKIISYMLAGTYTLNGDFTNGKTLYQQVFFNNNYHIIHLITSGINNVYMDYMGNWTILENDLCASVNKNRSVNNLINALNSSNLRTNRLLASIIKSYVDNHYDMNQLILERQGKFANDYIKVW